jgi:hypothetical protein
MLKETRAIRYHYATNTTRWSGHEEMLVSGISFIVYISMRLNRHERCVAASYVAVHGRKGYHGLLAH